MLDNVASIAQIVSVIIPLIFSIYSVYRKLEKKQEKFQTDIALITQRLDFIIKQFGPNGGGLRQAVNEMSDKLSLIESRQIEIGDKVAELDGRFSQHIIENNQ